jgi:hypothetical protein
VLPVIVSALTRRTRFLQVQWSWQRCNEKAEAMQEPASEPAEPLCIPGNSSLSRDRHQTTDFSESVADSLHASVASAEAC